MVHRSPPLDLLPPWHINVYARLPRFIYQIVFRSFFAVNNQVDKKEDNYIFVNFYFFYYIYVGEGLF